MREKDETPAFEARSHSPRFLKEAARLANKKRKSKGRRSSRRR